MIAQVLIVPLCVTKDIYCFGSTTVLGERSQGAPSAREVTTKKEKRKLVMRCLLHLNKVVGNWELRVMRSRSVTAF